MEALNILSNNPFVHEKPFKTMDTVIFFMKNFSQTFFKRLTRMQF